MVPGDLLELEVGPVAHGGHCVARYEGQVVFVRHALPGERVLASVTGSGGGGRFLRADAVQVLQPAPGRRPAPCPVAARCGGCDWQHATPATSRELKTAVVRESLARFAKVELPADFAVREVELPAHMAARHVASGVPEGLGWRTRGTLAVDEAGRAGFRAARSHEVVVAGQCLQLDPRLDDLRLFERSWPPGAGVRFAAPSRGVPLASSTAAGDTDDLAPEAGDADNLATDRAGADDVATDEAGTDDVAAAGPGTDVVEEVVAGRTFAVAWDGFWQVHPGAAEALVGHVRRMLAARPGERLLDLYSGVGLFGVSLAASVPGLRVLMVESERRACELAAQNGAGLEVRVRRADVRRWARRRGGVGRTELVVLDPPRTGAGAEVVRAVAASRARSIVYVACDPVALARDLATFAASGYRLAELVGLDLFPTTHHVECVAALVPASSA